MWVLYICVYAILTGFFTIFRKQAVKDSNVFFVLSISSIIGFLLVSWKATEAVAISWEYILLIMFKALIISISWALELIAIRDYYISILQPISAIKVIIGFVASVIIFNEPVLWWQLVGVLIVVLGIAFLKKDEKENLFLKRLDVNKKKERKVIIFFVISCILSEISAIIDKYTLQTITSNQLQWWFMLFCAFFITLFFFGMCCYKKKMLVKKEDWKNVFMYAFPFILIFMDSLLFKGLMDPNSKASLVSIIKQLSLVVSVVVGGLLFKEKNLKNRLYYLGFILCGIVIILI